MRDTSHRSREEFEAACDRIVREALAWWRSKRPLVLTELQHADNPEVNAVEEEEKRLARAVAAYLFPRRTR